MNSRFNATMALTRAERDFQLSPSRSAKDAEGFLAEMVNSTDRLAGDGRIRSTWNLPYGARPDARLDLFEPATELLGPRPALVFVHGGFWQEGSKSVSGFAASTFVLAGWSWVSVGYPLVPDCTLTEICALISDAVRYVRTHATELGIDPSRIVLAGHSAGGHLAACALADVLDSGVAATVAGAVLISGVFELAPIAASYVNDLVRMSEEEIERLSPIRFAPQKDVPVHVLIGADEPDAFHIQSDALCAAWSDHLTQMTKDVAPGRDHFDVLDELNDTGSATWRVIRAMV